MRNRNATPIIDAVKSMYVAQDARANIRKDGQNPYDNAQHWLAALAYDECVREPRNEREANRAMVRS